ncbi:MAG: GAF domain-containing protein [Candidatus Omnitrophica bacterium]|nr:GAF domain-containing protein [Candidatus Omnitrophota bacterium]
MTTLSPSLLQELKRTALFERVNVICGIVNFATDFRELLDQSLHKTAELFSAERGSIFITDKTGKKLILYSAVGMLSAETEKLEKQLGEGIIGKVAVLKAPIVVKDITADARFRGVTTKQRGYKTPSFICAPLLLKDQLIGVINLADKRSCASFSADELQLMDFLAAQIALNYRRIELYQQFKDALAETEQLKNRLGQSDQETSSLKKQIFVQEKFATIGKLAGGIAHEFNNPLDGVMRYTNLCLNHANNDDILRNYLLEIKHGLDRMIGIVHNLLACSRNEFPQRKEVDFKEALAYSLSSLQTDISHKKIAVDLRIHNNIPPIPDMGLERILSNLLRNAVDAMAENGCLTVNAEYRGKHLFFSITDTGCGIGPELIGRIFEPFFTTKDICKGCGLGLTIVGEIVKSYNGKINVESRIGQGTTFTINLPVNARTAQYVTN